jgi:hypothetical protein
MLLLPDHVPVSRATSLDSTRSGQILGAPPPAYTVRPGPAAVSSQDSLPSHHSALTSQVCRCVPGRPYRLNWIFFLPQFFGLPKPKTETFWMAQLLRPADPMRQASTHPPNRSLALPPAGVYPRLLGRFRRTDFCGPGSAGGCAEWVHARALSESIIPGRPV